MTNLEKYRNEIEQITFASDRVAVTRNGEVKACSMDNVDCDVCMFSDDDTCIIARRKWLQSEYKDPEVDWTKVLVDTPILVSQNGNDWYHRYFAYYEDGFVFAFHNGSTSWSADYYNEDVMVKWAFAKIAEVNKND